MHWKKEFDSFIAEEFELLKKGNSKFSLRAFAKKINISPTALSQILRGTHSWNLTPERAADIIKTLNISDVKRARLLTLVGAKHMLPSKEIEPDAFILLSDQDYSSVYACYDLPVPERRVPNIAKRLGLSQEKVETIVSFLSEKGYLQKNPQTSSYEACPTIWNVGDGPPNSLIQKFHRNNLSHAAKAIEEIPKEERHYSAIVFAGNKKQMDMLQIEIKKFREKVMNLMNCEHENDEIYKMSISLFPVRAPSQEIQ